MPIEGDLVSLDTSTCQAAYAVGPLQVNLADETGASTSDLAGTADSGISTQTSSSGTSASGGTGAFDGVGLPVLESSTTAAAYLKTSWRDPVGIKVTVLRDDLEWMYNPTTEDRLGG
jgi:hypothetical protein